MLVHGWMMSGRVFDPLLPHLTTVGARIVALDLRGAGSSGHEVQELSLSRFASDVLELASHLGAETFDLVGHSMGGQVAVLVAARAPLRVRSLALICPVPIAGMALPPEADGLFRSAGGDAGKLGTILDLACKVLSPADKKTLVDEALSIPAANVARVYELWSKGADADTHAVVAPTLVLGTDDPFLPPAFLEEAVVAKIAGAKLALLKGPGHYPTVERPAETAALLTAFWNER